MDDPHDEMLAMGDYNPARDLMKKRREEVNSIPHHYRTGPGRSPRFPPGWWILPSIVAGAVFWIVLVLMLR